MIIMGRRVPSDNLSFIHPILYLSFLAAGLAASIAIITAICSVRVRFRFRKKSSPPPSDPLEMGKDLDASKPPSSMVATGKPVTEESAHRTEEENNNEVQIKELPLPPAMQQPKDLFPSNNFKRATSERRAPFSLSLKMPRSLSVSKNWDQIKEEKIKGMLKTEESVWMKTIILGDKCVPDEEDPAVIYEGKGKRISAYHPRTHSSMSLSRQFSSLEPDDHLSIPKPQTPEERFNTT